MCSLSLLQTLVGETRVILGCYQAFNLYYYKYTIQGVNIFALSILFEVAVLLCKLKYFPKQDARHSLSLFCRSAAVGFYHFDCGLF